MNILPLVTTRSTTTKDYKNWFRTYGMRDVFDEDYATKIWESWLFKSRRFGKKTKNSDLQRHFPRLSFLKQLDIELDETRSSDIVVQHFYQKDKKLFRTSNNVIISEHCVKRWAEHTGRIPSLDLLTGWVLAFQKIYSTLNQDGQGFVEDITEVYHPDALLIGEMYRTPNGMEIYDFKNHRFYRFPDIGFRIKTVIPSDKLNDGQRYRWYKLQQQAEKLKG